MFTEKEIKEYDDAEKSFQNSVLECQFNGVQSLHEGEMKFHAGHWWVSSKLLDELNLKKPNSTAKGFKIDELHPKSYIVIVTRMWWAIDSELLDALYGSKKINC